MSIFKTAYDTTYGSSIITKKIEEAINEACIRGLGYSDNLNLISSLKIKPLFISGRSGLDDHIPLFAHPMLVRTLSGSNKGDEYIVTDIRPFVSKSNNTSNDEIVIRNTTEFNFTKIRAIMNLAWLTDNVMYLKNNLGFAATVYGSLISENITKRYALDPKEQLMIFITCHLYYQTLFYDKKVFDESDYQMFAVHTIKATKAPAALVLEVFDKLTQGFNDMHSLVEGIKLVIDNVRLKDLNAGVLITTLGNSWYGLNSKEIIATAIEHPPTWTAICYVSIIERTYKNSTVARVADRFGKNGAGADFIKSITQLASSYNKEERSHVTHIKTESISTPDEVLAMFNRFE